MTLNRYTKTEWRNDSPPNIDETNLNKIENGISDNRDAIIAIQESQTTDEADIAQLQTDVVKKVDKIEGKGLSANDYTDAEKSKLEGIASGAEVNVQADWNEADSSSDAFIKNKPYIPEKVSDLTNDLNFVALGETSGTAYRGDRGKTAYDHSQVRSGNPHGVTKSEVGLGNVDNTSDANKPVSTAQQTALDAKQGLLSVEQKLSAGYLVNEYYELS